MDRLMQYQIMVAEVLASVSKQVQTATIEALLSIDTLHNQYMLVADGWEGTKRYYSILAHIELKENAQVWLRCDNTDLEIGQMLIDKGIRHQDIVPAFYSPQMREYIKIA